MTGHQQAGTPAAAISTAAVQLLREYTGRGPTRSRTTIDHDMVVIMLGDTLTRGEHKLVESGQGERVLELRHDYQGVMREELVEAVEEALGRNVIAFMSQNHIDPDLAVEVMVLEPEPSGASTVDREESDDHAERGT
jgi:uncharacterized protein YbcI